MKIEVKYNCKVLDTTPRPLTRKDFEPLRIGWFKKVQIMKSIKEIGRPATSRRAP